MQEDHDACLLDSPFQNHRFSLVGLDVVGNANMPVLHPATRSFAKFESTTARETQEDAGNGHYLSRLVDDSSTMTAVQPNIGEM